MFPSLYAQDASPASGIGMGQVVMMVVIFAIFYFLLIRPQSKRARELEKKRQSVKKGDRVVTGGGLFGTVAQVKENTKSITVEISKGVRVEALQSTLMDVIPKEKNDDKK